MLMSPHYGGVKRDGPVDVTRRISGGLHLLEQLLPCPVARPQSVPFADGLPRTEPFGQVTPLNARPHPVQNPVNYLPVVPPPATTPVADRQQRPPLLLGLKHPGVLSSQPVQLHRHAHATVATLGRGLGLVLANPPPQRLSGDAEIRGHSRVRPLASCGAVKRDSIPPKLLRVRRLASHLDIFPWTIKIHCQGVHSKGSASFDALPPGRWTARRRGPARHHTSRRSPSAPDQDGPPTASKAPAGSRPRAAIRYRPGSAHQAACCRRAGTTTPSWRPGSTRCPPGAVVEGKRARSEHVGSPQDVHFLCYVKGFLYSLMPRALRGVVRDGAQGGEHIGLHPCSAPVAQPGLPRLGRLRA